MLGVVVLLPASFVDAQPRESLDMTGLIAPVEIVKDRWGGSMVDSVTESTLLLEPVSPTGGGTGAS